MQRGSHPWNQPNWQIPVFFQFLNPAMEELAEHFLRLLQCARRHPVMSSGLSLQTVADEIEVFRRRSDRKDQFESQCERNTTALETGRDKIMAQIYRGYLYESCRTRALSAKAVGPGAGRRGGQSSDGIPGGWEFVTSFSDVSARFRLKPWLYALHIWTATRHRFCHPCDDILV
jgi:hypothetical protein